LPSQRQTNNNSLAIDFVIPVGNKRIFEFLPTKDYATSSRANSSTLSCISTGSTSEHRLESKLDELKLASTQSGDRHLLEYLFFCSDPAHLQRLAEEGFPQPPSQPLSNSLTMALQTSPPETALQTGAAEQTRHVMVAKVLMSHCCKVRFYQSNYAAIMQSMNQSIKQSHNHPTNRSVHPSIIQSIIQRINPSTSILQSINSSIIPLLSQSIKQQVKRHVLSMELIKQFDIHSQRSQNVNMSGVLNGISHCKACMACRVCSSF